MQCEVSNVSPSCDSGIVYSCLEMRGESIPISHMITVQVNRAKGRPGLRASR